MSYRHAPLPFDLRSLEILLAVCENGTMARAAKSLGITQPAVSQAIADLEKRAGTNLFDRSVRPIAMTLAGGLLRQHASSLIADARRIGPLLRQTKYGKLPHLRVGLVDSLNHALAVPISQHLSRHVEMTTILSGLTASHASDLLTRRLDLFIGVDDLADLAGLERWELLREPYILCLPRKAPQISTVPDLKQLALQLPLIRFSSRSQTGLEIERHLRRLQIEAPNRFEFDTPAGVSSMVAAGHGFAITTPLCIAESCISSKEIRTSSLPGPKITRKVTLVARQRELGNLPRDLAEIGRKRLAQFIEGIEKS
jgi:DNA-binding transcriptional LysR family regulator